MFTQIFRRIPVALPLILIQTAVIGQTAIEPTLTVVQQWVETERRIAAERATWEADKAAIGHLMEVYRQELALLNEQIASAAAEVSAAESQRLNLVDRDQALRDLETAVLQQLIGAEIALRKLYQRLPPPSREELAPLYTALPDDPANSKLAIGQRIQPMAAMLTQIQKFNTAVTIVEEFREFEAGSPVLVETVYFGLGAAYYVDKANLHAGFGVPTDSGWTWSADNAIIAPVRAFVDTYRGKRQAAYVDLPVNLR
jgi:hypothetical protein